MQNRHNNKAPLLSVILPVYNAEKYIKESIYSVLNQTFSDFELIILNDGSKDNSDEVIKSINDDRIVYIEHANMGLAATLNKGIELSRANLIARQDNDDLSMPTRFQKQIEFFNHHPDYALLGTCAEIINENGEDKKMYLDHPLKDAELKFALLFNNPFVHSSVMFKKQVIQKIGTYYTGKEVFEDYNLWSRVAQTDKVANLSDRLLKYREVNTSMSRTANDYKQKVINQSVNNIKLYLNNADEKTVIDFVKYLSGTKETGNFNKTYLFIKETMFQLCENFSEKEKINKGLVEKEALKQVLNFKRTYLNSIINNNTDGFLKKIISKIERKIFFVKYAKYLN